MDNEIIKRINALLVDGFEIDGALIIPGANLKTTLDLDSLDYIDLVAITESNFGCKIMTEDFDNIITFQDLYNYIISHIKK
jgi:acyl carrier protein